jgi:large subunit ribosomal protein L15
MELHNLKPAKGSIKKAKRSVGRGEGSKKGGTSTRGHKGAKSRSGYSKKIGFEGGQQPLQRRVPKFGFTSPNRVEYNGVNIDTIQSLFLSKKINDTICKQDLINNGLVQKNDLVKILGRGKLNVKLNITANAFSASAKSAIEKAEGTVNIVEK